MRVVTIPPSTPFLPTLIAALIDGRLVAGFEARKNPERLAAVTLYLPTRRAVELARETFLDVLDTDAALLPRIVPLRDIDEDELAFAEPAGEGAATLDLPPPLTPLERRLLLAPLIAAWAAQLAPGDPDAVPLVTGGTAATLALADDLARLIDDMLRRGVGWEALDALVPEEFDRYWQLTLRFLRIAREHWPPILEAQGRVEPVLREQALIAAEAERLARHSGPVIAAGSTGSIPTTAAFLHAIARLPHGAVVLPGLDRGLDDAAWQAIGGAADADGRLAPPLPSHPQFALHGLLARFGLAREEVIGLAPPAPSGREVLASEALRPSAATADWHTRLAEPAVAAAIAAGMTHVAVIAAATPEVEALAIAVALREAHEHGRSAALVTPDRALARRVMAALGRWRVAFDDSGGTALAEAPAGLFARLAAAAVAEGLAPATLLALLKHPLARLGADPGAHAAAVAALELALFRGPRPATTCAGLRDALVALRSQLADLKAGRPSTLHAAEPRARLDAAALDAAAMLLERLATALAPFESLAPGRHPFAALAARHRDVVMALCGAADEAIAAFAGRDGEMLAETFDALIGFDGPMQLTMPLADYPDAFAAALADRVVRAPPPRGARVQIYGVIEARLTEHDRVVLGSLVEGVWPPAPRIDPWLSRPMRHQLGLDLPERRIGLSAHDFAQALGAPEVILSYAAKTGGAPTVASRFLHRLEAVAGPERWAAAKRQGARYLAYASALDWPAGSVARPVSQPAPKPPRATRPTRLSVTQIEDWLRDPYTIFARHILKLSPLEPVDMALSAADRGSAIHAALGSFAERFTSALPDDVFGELVRSGEVSFAPLLARPEARALWWPRFLRIARWFAGWERDRRIDVATIFAEAPGEMIVPSEGGFRLTARADRIERRTDGSYALVDYKTGIPPTGKQVVIGLAPQLTLEAAILRAGGFAGIPAGASVSELAYIRLSGNSPAGEAISLKLSRGRGESPQSPDEVAAAALRNLENLVRAFDNEQQPYRSLNLSMWARRYGDYDDLARIKEWAATSGEGEE